jgi:hypothetical protein
MCADAMLQYKHKLAQARYKKKYKLVMSVPSQQPTISVG